MTEAHPTSASVLARIIDTANPASVVCCGITAEQVAGVWANHHENGRLFALDAADPNADLPLPITADLALITDTLEHLSHNDGALLMGQLRNYGTHQIAVLVPASADWGFTDFIGLGFQRHAELEGEDGPLTLYTYNLSSYNHKRAWNNPDNWANPHMWGKSWW
ncbi:MAG: DUF6231 family protein [Pseudomonadota bacterium]|nr:DUF6231 family protein [Pseudomonadota bacterium]